jgi:hypothetical protein
MGVKIKKRGRKWYEYVNYHGKRCGTMRVSNARNRPQTVTKPTIRQLDITESLVFPS